MFLKEKVEGEVEIVLCRRKQLQESFYASVLVCGRLLCLIRKYSSSHIKEETTVTEEVITNFGCLS